MIVLFLSVVLGASGLEAAEAAYAGGRFGEALQLFEEALAEPQAADGALLYNLGNCAFRLGRYADAKLYYSRAKLRLPRDRAVAFNLRLAEERLGLEPPAAESFRAAVEGLAASFLPAELLAIAAVLQLAGLAGLVFFWRRPGFCRTAAVLVLLLGLAAGARIVHEEWFPAPAEGVVLAAAIGLRTEPHRDFPVISRLDAGETVRILEMSDRWARVEHAGGHGWTERKGIGVVE